MHADGTLREVDHSRYFRIGEIYDRDENVSHVIAYPYYDPGAVLDRSPGFIKVMNRIRVIYYDPSGRDPDYPGANFVQTFVYGGNESGGVIGPPVTAPQYAGVAYLCTIGEQDGWYDDVQDSFARALIRRTNNVRVLNKDDNRPDLIPEGAIPDAGPGEAKTIKQQVDAFRDQPNPALVVAPDDIVTGSYKTEFQHAEGREQLEQLYNECYLAAGVPPGIFGINLGKGESGTARERAQDRAAARIRGVRNDLRRCLPALVRAMGAPASRGEIKFGWRTQPFADRQTLINNNVRLVEARIIKPEKAAEDLGYDPSDVPEEPEPAPTTAAPVGAGADNGES